MKQSMLLLACPIFIESNLPLPTHRSRLCLLGSTHCSTMTLEKAEGVGCCGVVNWALTPKSEDLNLRA